MSVAWWALIVSSLSFMSSVGMLIWNIYSFRQNGPQVAIEFHTSYSATLAHHAPNDYQEWQVVYYGHESGGAPFWCQSIVGSVTVINAGRAAVDVAKVSLTALDGPRGVAVSCGVIDCEKEVNPVRLESNSSTVYRFDMSSVGKNQDTSNLTFEVFAVLGNGKVKKLSAGDNSTFRKQLDMAKAMHARELALNVATSNERIK